MYKVEATGDVLRIVGQRQAVSAAAPSGAVGDTSSQIEAALVEAVRRDGDREAFGQLYSAYARMVHGILLARVPYAEVSDLVQDVFLHALKKLDSLRDPTAFGPWLAMITRNRAMDFHRRARDTTELSEQMAATGGGASPRAEANEALAFIRELPEAYREPLILRFVEGMTGPEIAERTGLQPASVRVNIHRGMKLLREKIAAAAAGGGKEH
ncbi:MAG: RNA polymerase sigma factor [Pyrinomonadaceae bacterium]